MPSTPLPDGLHLLNFNPSATQFMIDLGKADAKKHVEMGEGYMFDLVRHWGGNEEIKR
jgi:hypothetical protein